MNFFNEFLKPLSISFKYLKIFYLIQRTSRNNLCNSWVLELLLDVFTLHMFGISISMHYNWSLNVTHYLLLTNTFYRNLQNIQ